MNIYHTTRARAINALESAGFAYERGIVMGEGVYRDAERRRAWISEARAQ